ncbi:Protein N-terminal and lysine N-methyltransferase efm7 [Rhizina undulata]
MISDSEPEETLDLFTEPDDYYVPEKPATSATHTLLTGDKETLTLRLVGHNPLWGHMLWNAGRVVSEYLEENRETLVAGRNVLELGAGAGLPSLVCALRGAKKIVLTDYPDADLVANLSHNASLLPSEPASKITTTGYLWGRDPAPLLEGIENGFDTLILSDLLFNHSEHEKLVDTVSSTLRKSASSRAVVFFTPHRPWLYEKDLVFFKIVEERGFVVEKVLERKMEAPMFEEDRGDRELRRTVFGFEVRWSEEGLGSK